MNREFEDESKEANINSDIYKLNETKIKDLELSIDSSNLPAVELDSFNPTKADWRICLQEGKILCDESQNALDDEYLVQNPWKCKGYLHVNCLKEWLKVHRKILFTTEVWTSYIWDNIRCEICLQAYPDHIYCSLGTVGRYKKIRLLDLDDLQMVDDDRIIDLENDDITNLPPLENKLPYEYCILEGYKTIKEENSNKM